MDIIKVKNLTKSYAGHRALNNLSLNIKKGDFFGLLGPNGAGKTTFVRCLLDILPFEHGSIFIEEVPHKRPQSRAALAYLPEKFSFYPNYSVYQTLHFFAGTKIENKKEIPLQIETSLEKMGIQDLSSKKIKHLSKGQLQRVGLAQMLVGRPHILILDEPFSGLDPLLIKEMKDLLKELKNEGKTIIVNSHILSEVEIICDSLAIIDKGKLLAHKRMNELDISLEDFFCQTIENQRGSR
ncbi:MAG: ABC transporter ATP-binding protein [Bdellovibrionota bacterium]|nr:ABC transporter ATP-binding protein [Bdellovibrionota bacterium]